MLSFQELWIKCEECQKNNKASNTNSLVQELLLKTNLYKAFNDKSSEISSDELQKIKSRTMGEILLTLTGLSLTDDINVYEALVSAFQFKFPNDHIT